MQAESVWSDLRRDLRRHLRELPDSSKSKVQSAEFHKSLESVYILNKATKSIKATVWGWNNV